MIFRLSRWDGLFEPRRSEWPCNSTSFNIIQHLLQWLRTLFAVGQQLQSSITSFQTLATPMTPMTPNSHPEFPSLPDWPRNFKDDSAILSNVLVVVEATCGTAALVWALDILQRSLHHNLEQLFPHSPYDTPRRYSGFAMMGPCCLSTGSSAINRTKCTKNRLDWWGDEFQRWYPHNSNQLLVLSIYE